MLIAIFLVLVLLTLFALPVWPHSRTWGYVPSAGIALVLLMLLAMHLLYMI